MVYPKGDKKIGEKARRPRPGLPILDEDIIHLIKYYHGNISRVADRLGACRSAIIKRINNSPTLKAHLEDARERIIDNLEECSWHKALEGDTSMIMFLLKTIGKNRGYSFDDKNQATDMIAAAFQFVLNSSKNPAIPTKSTSKSSPQITPQITHNDYTTTIECESIPQYTPSIIPPNSHAPSST